MTIEKIRHYCPRFLKYVNQGGNVITQEGMEIIFSDFCEKAGIKELHKREVVRQLIEALQMFGIEAEDLQAVLEDCGLSTTCALINGYALIMNSQN
jgi:hypothetical protein